MAHKSPFVAEHQAPLAIQWHSVPADTVLEHIAVGPDGLNDAAVARQRAAYGTNELPPPKRDRPLVVYLRQFMSPLIYLLLAAAAVSAAIGEWSDAGFIFGVLQVNAVIGTVQEWRAAASAQALMRMTPSTAIVLREGRRQRVDSTELVIGDIVDLESGVQVPADIRLLSAQDLVVDESLLTGESTPVVKDPAALVAATAMLGDRATMVYAATSISSGRATGVVTAVGIATQLGAIAGTLSGGAIAPLLIRLRRLARQIAILMTGAIIAIAVVQILQGISVTQVFFVAVALAVAAIPEGLPVAITVALSVGMARMGRRNVIVRSLPAVEGLGACTLIASDKTGTLTCNELTAKRLWLPEIGAVAVGGEGYHIDGQLTREGQPLDASERRTAETLARAGALCNEAHLYLADGNVHHLGDTVDVAFQILASKMGLERGALLQQAPQIGLIPYEPRRRFAASFHREPDAEVRVYVKGAAETVLPMCARTDERERWLAVADEMAAEGHRVLAVASGPADEAAAGYPSEATLTDLKFLGFVGLIDPVRPEASAAIAACRSAGVEVRMITGDHPATALTIACELGLAREPGEVMTGAELAEILSGNTSDYTPAQREAIAHPKIFARVDALQKLHIVRALQQSGHFVAVTGDGVNDAPALEAAHIGVAMGESGTDVARAAADLMIADDNFSSIVAGIEEGRIAYDNVRKVTMLLIGTGIGEIVLFVLALVAGLPIPLFAVQLLWLNLVTNGIQDVALAFEKGEADVLSRSPRPPDQPIFDRRMITQTALVGGYMGFVGFAYFLWAIRSGMPEDQARTTLLLLMVWFENVHVFNCRSETRSAFAVPLRANPWVILAVAAALWLHLGAMYWSDS
ncbi:MAG: HAD-IC family P-type ATPase, partial [Alphaproteobacteria bacterium]|nr:HAD-IC family P-type ATPase [Alphaproteobacteria bacterium]